MYYEDDYDSPDPADPDYPDYLDYQIVQLSPADVQRITGRNRQAQKAKALGEQVWLDQPIAERRYLASPDPTFPGYPTKSGDDQSQDQDMYGLHSYQPFQLTKKDIEHLQYQPRQPAMSQVSILGI